MEFVNIGYFVSSEGSGGQFHINMDKIIWGGGQEDRVCLFFFFFYIDPLTLTLKCIIFLGFYLCLLKCRYLCLYAAHLVLLVQGKLCRKADLSAVLTVFIVLGEKSVMKQVLQRDNAHCAGCIIFLMHLVKKSASMNYIFVIYNCTFYISSTSRIG